MSRGGERRRYGLPPRLGPDEERAIIAALERYFEADDAGPDPWAFAGRLEATGGGALHTRRVAGAWRRTTRAPFARRGVPPVAGRGDAH